MTDDDQPNDRMRDRTEESSLKLRLLLDADRGLVTGLVLLVVFVGVLAAGALLPNALAALRSGDAVETLFQALVGGIVTGVTLVVTLNQLVLSQELGAVGDQREQMEESLAFREDAAAAIDTPVSPPQPAQFLRALVQAAGDRARTLRSRVPEDGSDLSSSVEQLTDSLVENAEGVSAELDGARFGTFAVVAAALDFNYSWKVFAARRIRAEHGDALSAEADAALADLLTVLELFGPAREHVKTLYFQWELVDLSRTVLVAALPALVVSVAALAFVDIAALPGTVLGVPVAVAMLAAATTVALLPFAVLFAYVVRIATVAKRTLSIGPFILRETEQAEGVEWD